MKKNIWFIILFLQLCCNSSFGQLSQGGIPYALQNRKKGQNTISENSLNKEIRSIKTALIDRNTIDSILLGNQKYDDSQFAYGFDVNIDIKTEGTIDSIEIGILYRLLVISPQAKSINLIFSQYHVPHGAKLFIYSPDGRHVVGSFTSNNNKTCGILPTIPIYGDSIIVEYFEPYFPEYSGTIIIGKINHDFIGLVAESNLIADNINNSGTCQVDVKCSPEGDNWQLEKKSVCKVIIDGIYLCSGTLLNNTNLDGSPYFLTANHCINSQLEANTCVFIFNYERDSCGGGVTYTNQSISSGILRSTNPDSDFTLLELSHPPLSTWNPFYAGWDRNNIQPPGGVCIHHPAGDVKKISTYTMTPVSSDCILGKPQNNFYLINQWRATLNGHAVTEGGSSGSPLFNSSHRVIGQLYGGCSGHNENCTNPSNDYSNYGKLFSSWDYNGTANNQLKNWLDPNDLDIYSLNGAVVCPQDIMENVNLNYTVNAGVVEIRKATKDIISNCNIESGASVHYQAGRSINLVSPTHIQHGSVFLAEIQPFDCVPGCHPIDFQTINTDFQNSGNICFYQVNAQSYDLRIVNRNGQTICQIMGNTNGYINFVQMPMNIAAGVYFATITLYNECNEYSESFSIANVKSKTLPIDNTRTYEEIADLSFQVIPNPNNGSFTIKVNKNSEEFYTIDLITSMGISIFRIEHLSEPYIQINKNTLPPGVYFIRLGNKNGFVSQKIIIQ